MSNGTIQSPVTVLLHFLFWFTTLSSVAECVFAPCVSLHLSCCCFSPFPRPYSFSPGAPVPTLLVLSSWHFPHLPPPLAISFSASNPANSYAPPPTPNIVIPAHCQWDLAGVTFPKIKPLVISVLFPQTAHILESTFSPESDLLCW